MCSHHISTVFLYQCHDVTSDHIVVLPFFRNDGSIEVWMFGEEDVDLYQQMVGQI